MCLLCSVCGSGAITSEMLQTVELHVVADHGWCLQSWNFKLDWKPNVHAIFSRWYLFWEGQLNTRTGRSNARVSWSPSVPSRLRGCLITYEHSRSISASRCVHYNLFEGEEQCFAKVFEWDNGQAFVLHVSKTTMNWIFWTRRYLS